MTVKAVWHIVKESAKRISVAKWRPMKYLTLRWLVIGVASPATLKL